MLFWHPEIIIMEVCYGMVCKFHLEWLLWFSLVCLHWFVVVITTNRPLLLSLFGECYCSKCLTGWLFPCHVPLKQKVLQKKHYIERGALSSSQHWLVGVCSALRKRNLKFNKIMMRKIQISVIAKESRFLKFIFKNLWRRAVLLLISIE